MKWSPPGWLSCTSLEFLLCSLTSSRCLGRSAEALLCPGGFFCATALGVRGSLTRQHGKEKLFTWFHTCFLDSDLFYCSRKDVFTVIFIILGSPSTRDGCDMTYIGLGWGPEDLAMAGSVPAAVWGATHLKNTSAQDFQEPETAFQLKMCTVLFLVLFQLAICIWGGSFLFLLPSCCYCFFNLSHLTC